MDVCDDDVLPVQCVPPFLLLDDEILDDPCAFLSRRPPKRRNPFESEGGPLLKTHLSTRFVTNPVAAKELAFAKVMAGKEIQRKQSARARLAMSPFSPMQTLKECLVCKTCQETRSIVDIFQCQYCDQSVCCNCARSCATCMGFFCTTCSLLNFDACYDRAFCLDCNVYRDN